MGGNSQSRQARAQSESQTSAPVSSLDKTGASVYNTDIRTALTCQVRSFPVASLELEENAAAFLGGGYFLRFKIPKTTVASSIRSVSTSIVVMRVTPLMQGNNLAVPYQQFHYSIHGFILSINRSSGRLLCIYLVFQSHKPQNRHTSRCACFPYITLYPSCDPLSPTTESADRILYLPR